MTVRLYVEGGGDAKLQHAEFRKAFRQLLSRAGFAGRQPKIIAGGGRDQTFDAFKTALKDGGAGHPIMLVDSEDPVTNGSTEPDSPAAWTHLRARDRWQRPAVAANDQAQLMATCMETWAMADRIALRTMFDSPLRQNALLPVTDLESRSRDAVLHALERATQDCGPGKAYKKGKRSFQVVAHLNPATLRSALPHFARFIDTLDRHLPQR